MSLKDTLNKLIGRAAAPLEKGLRAVPAVNRRIEAQYDEVMPALERSLKPYRDLYPSYAQLPEAGRDRDDILREMAELQAIEAERWRDGFVSGAVYHGDAEHIDFLNRVYALNSQSNPLHADVWPSAAKYEAEIVAMTADMLGASPRPSHWEGLGQGLLASHWEGLGQGLLPSHWEGLGEGLLPSHWEGLGEGQRSAEPSPAAARRASSWR